MAKSKEGKDTEFFLGQIRALKSENRHLKKKLRQYEKIEHFYDKDDDNEPELPVKEEKKETCISCAKGEMIDITILDRSFKRCNVCNIRTTAVKVKKNGSSI